jgi:hypothetical protein
MSHVQDQPGSLLPSYSLLPEDLCVLPSQIVTAQDYLQNSQILRLQCLERLEKGKSFMLGVRGRFLLYGTKVSSLLSVDLGSWVMGNQS